MTFAVQPGVGIREGIDLTLEDIGGRVHATLIVIRSDGRLRPKLDQRAMSVREALRVAKEEGRLLGFGTYRIVSLDGLRAIKGADMVGAFEEIEAQINEASNFVTADVVTGKVQGRIEEMGKGVSDLERLRAKLLRIIGEPH